MYKRLTRGRGEIFVSNIEKALTSAEILDIVANKSGGVHFCGVGGVSMSSLFCLSRYFGAECSGSDREEGDMVRALMEIGENVYVGEKESLPEKTKLLVYSHAIDSAHSERVYARANGIFEVSRAQYLGALMQCYDKKIGVSGSHGKSTVTAMISHVLEKNAFNPTTLSGAELSGSSLSFRIGTLDYLVYEACEYKDSFLSFSPSLSVFLNMELDHVDYFTDKDRLRKSFLSAIELADKAIINIDDEGLFSLLGECGETGIITYGRGEGADYRYEIISDEAYKMRLRMFFKEKELGEVALNMLGSFNISNAAAAIAAAHQLGIDFCECAKAISEFSPIGRRLERIGKYKGRQIFYDYAHHPTEIRASIEAVRSFSKGGVTVIFRPHTYSRTKGLWKDFLSALSCADSVILLEISAVREEAIQGITSQRLAEECGAVFVKDKREIAKNLDETDGAIILMGAADVTDVKKFLLCEKKC